MLGKARQGKVIVILDGRRTIGMKVIAEIEGVTPLLMNRFRDAEIEGKSKKKGEQKESDIKDKLYLTMKFKETVKDILLRHSGTSYCAHDIIKIMDVDEDKLADIKEVLEQLHDDGDAKKQIQFCEETNGSCRKFQIAKHLRGAYKPPEEDEREFKCDCGKGFTSAKNLNLHRKIGKCGKSDIEEVEKVKGNFKCGCGKKFGTEGWFEQHKKKCDGTPKSAVKRKYTKREIAFLAHEPNHKSMSELLDTLEQTAAEIRKRLL